jgi:hypothetical protein
LEQDARWIELISKIKQLAIGMEKWVLSFFVRVLKAIVKDKKMLVLNTKICAIGLRLSGRGETKDSYNSVLKQLWQK